MARTGPVGSGECSAYNTGVELLDRLGAGIKNVFKKKKDESTVRTLKVTQHFGRVWTDADREAAMMEAEDGRFFKLGQILDAMRGDGKIRGLLHTRTSGMLSLPPLFEGDDLAVDALRGKPERDDAVTGEKSPHVPGMWNRIVPKNALTLMLFDGIMAGVAIGYLEDDHRPGEATWRKLKHLNIHQLQYRQHTEEWFYQDRVRGELRVNPGDGRWVLFTPYGRNRPWVHGAWNACARAFVTKDGARCDQDRWARSLADALRYIETNQNSNEPDYLAMLDFVQNHWAHVPGVVLPAGAKAGVVESQGKGYEIYSRQWEQANDEIVVSLAGQTVTSEGGNGFAAGDVWRGIDSDLIQAIADATGEWIADEILSPYTEHICLGRGIVRVAWSVREQAQKVAAGEAAKVAAEALKALNEVAAVEGKRAKMASFLTGIGVDVEFADIAPPAPPVAQVAPSLTQLDGVTTSDEEPADDESAAALAAKMTEHKVERCQHNAVNRCRLCGIERVRDFIPGQNGADHVWTVAWKPIAKPAVVSTSVQ